jgi:hypothetical protein
MAGLPQILIPPAGVVGCEPELVAGKATFYYLRNKKKLRNYITAHVNPSTNCLGYTVENVPKDGLGCPGRWLVRQAWEHFRQCGAPIAAIRGEWSFGDNLDTVNRLTHGNQLTIAEAALQTWSADRAREYGFTTVMLLACDGVPGQYQSVDVLFTP